MPRRWTARLILLLLTLEAGLICSVYLEEIDWLRRSERALFSILLSFVRETDPSKVIVEPLQEEEGTWQIRPLRRRERVEPEWGLLGVQLDERLFDGKEPTPVEMAFLLSRLHASGVREVGFTSGLAWEDARELDLLTLDSALKPFDYVLLPLEMSEVPSAGQLPGWLEDSLIPPSAIHGDVSRLPLLNTVAELPSVKGREGLTFAWPDFGARDPRFRSEERIPLLARWGDQLLPSWPLVWAMRNEGCTGEDLEVEPGAWLRFGKGGLLLPIDDFGRAKVKVEDSELSEVEPATALVPLDPEDLPELPKSVMLLDATEPARASRAERMAREAQALLRGWVAGEGEVFRRIPIGGEALMFLQILFVGIFSLHLRTVWQAVAFLVLMAALVAFLLAALHWRGLWSPLLPLLVSSVVGWCLSGYLQQIAHPLEEKKKEVVQD